MDMNNARAVLRLRAKHATIHHIRNREGDYWTGGEWSGDPRDALRFHCHRAGVIGIARDFREGGFGLDVVPARRAGGGK